MEDINKLINSVMIDGKLRKPTEDEVSQYLEDTASHISGVVSNMELASKLLLNQAYVHDESKYSPEEFDTYSVVSPLYKSVEYGTPAHDKLSDLLGPAWDHHQSVNPHHPQYYEDGVDGMDLLYMIEMLSDWHSASLRDPDQVFSDSLEYNINKHGIDDQLASILRNTARRLGMIEEEGSESDE